MLVNIKYVYINKSEKGSSNISRMAPVVLFAENLTEE
mgnify:FL=1|jgi:hypothetical protein